MPRKHTVETMLCNRLARKKVSFLNQQESTAAVSLHQLLKVAIKQETAVSLELFRSFKCFLQLLLSDQDTYERCMED